MINKTLVKVVENTLKRNRVRPCKNLGSVTIWFSEQEGNPAEVVSDILEAIDEEFGSQAVAINNRGEEWVLSSVVVENFGINEEFHGSITVDIGECLFCISYGLVGDEDSGDSCFTIYFE